MKLLIVLSVAVVVLGSQAWAANCDHGKQVIEEDTRGTVTSTTEKSKVKQFFKRIKSTIEKAEPWVEELEKEAKRLEESAKRLGETVIHRFGDFVDKLMGHEFHHHTGGGSSYSGGVIPTVSISSLPPVADVSIVADVVEMSAVAPDDAHKSDSSSTATDAAVATKTTTTTTTSTTSGPLRLKPVTSSTALPPSDNANDSLDDPNKDILDNDILSDENCPDGFVADVNGVCQRIAY